MGLPSSEACERNKDPILRVLRVAFDKATRVLEIGSGTGQHAVYFARELSHLLWQPSDTPEYLEMLRKRCELEATGNVLHPFELDVRHRPWPISTVDAIFSANTLHIMDWSSVEHFFAGAGEALRRGGTLCVYGPFKYRGDYTSASNAAFDRILKNRDPASGIRDFESVDRLARAAGLALDADHAMPANNQLLVWSHRG